MENRAPFGGQTQAEWFIAIGDQSVGPMSASDVYDRVMAGELTWVSYVWKDGMGEWARIADVPTFKAAVPPPPALKPQALPPAPPPATKRLQTREWFLFYNDSQYGPFTEEEVQGLAGVGKITPESFVWKDGMSDWEKIGSLTHFAAYFKNVVAKAAALEKTVSLDKNPEPANQRVGPRKPILAKVIIAEGDQILVGMARDISIGGMQVLSEFLPSKVGSRLKLNVSPPEPTSAAFTPFVAEGLVVRLLEDRRGFSFRFDELSASARQIIERIVSG
jgi:hypothetical protein